MSILVGKWNLLNDFFFFNEDGTSWIEDKE